MSESLIIRLGQRAEQTVQWLVWSSIEREIIASGELESAQQLSKLQERAGGRPVITLVSSAALLLRRVTLPGKYTSQSAKAIPYLLEEQIASDVEQLHIVELGHRECDVDLIAVDKQQIEEWQRWLDQAGLHTTQMIPDLLALPLADEGWSAMQIGSDWLIRHSATQGWVCDTTLLPLLLKTQSEPVTIHCHTPAPAIEGVNWQPCDPELPLLLLAKEAFSSKINLLQGAYRVRGALTERWQAWRGVVITTLALLLVALIERGITLYQLKGEEARLKTQQTQIYRQLFPEEKRIINVRVQMESHLRELGQSDNGGLSTLMKLIPIFNQVKGAQVELLRFDQPRNELRLQISAPSFSEFEQLRQASSSHFSVEQGELRNENGRVSGTLVFRSQS